MVIKVCCACDRQFDAIGNAMTCSETCSSSIRKQKAINRTRQWALLNRERRNAWLRKWRRKNHLKVRLGKRKDYLKNKVKRNAQILAWLKSDRPTAIVARLKIKLRVRILGALNGNRKFGNTIELVGCSMSFLKKHLEIQFLPGMTWDNHGAWHIDHKRPCKSFNLKDAAEQRQCFHWSNLRPLWAAENLKKGAAWHAA